MDLHLLLTLPQFLDLLRSLFVRYRSNEYKKKCFYVHCPMGNQMSKINNKATRNNPIYLVLVSLLLTLNRYPPIGYVMFSQVTNISKTKPCRNSQKVNQDDQQLCPKCSDALTVILRKFCWSNKQVKDKCSKIQKISIKIWQSKMKMISQLPTFFRFRGRFLRSRSFLCLYTSFIKPEIYSSVCVRR